MKQWNEGRRKELTDGASCRLTPSPSVLLVLSPLQCALTYKLLLMTLCAHGSSNVAITEYCLFTTSYA